MNCYGLGERVRAFSDALRRAVSDSGGRLLAIAHKNADPDAVASALVLASIAKKHAKAFRVAVGFPEGVNQASKRLLSKIALDEDIAITSSPSELEAGKWAVVVVDAASAKQLGEFAGLIADGGYLLVDHHSTNSLVGGALSALYDPGEPSASELVYLLAVCGFGASLEKWEATLLLTGIIYDTRHLVLAKPRTLRVAADIVDGGVSLQEVVKLLQSEGPSISERIARLKAAKRMHVYRIDNTLVAVTRVGAFEGSAARAMLDLGADVAIAVSQQGAESRVIGRARSEALGKLGIDLGKFMEMVSARSGGGHAQAAGAVVRGSPEEVIAKIVDALRALAKSRGYNLEAVV